MMMTHPRGSADHENEASAEAGVYDKRDYGVDPLSPRLPPPPFPMRPLELGSPGMLPPLCSLPLWSALELPTGTSRASETVRGRLEKTRPRPMRTL